MYMYIKRILNCSLHQGYILIDFNWGGWGVLLGVLEHPLKAKECDLIWPMSVSLASDSRIISYFDKTLYQPLYNRILTY